MTYEKSFPLIRVRIQERRSKTIGLYNMGKAKDDALFRIAIIPSKRVDA